MQHAFISNSSIMYLLCKTSPNAISLLITFFEMSRYVKVSCSSFLGLYENHGAKVKKSRHTFRKVAKFTANSRCQLTVIYSVKNVSLTNIFVLCLVNNRSCIVISQNDLTLIVLSNFQEQF